MPAGKTPILVSTLTQTCWEYDCWLMLHIGSAFSSYCLNTNLLVCLDLLVLNGLFSKNDDLFCGGLDDPQETWEIT